MAQIETIDWEAKRFYLHIDTTTNGFDAWEAFAEVRLLQQANAANEQNYRLFLQRQGGFPKGNNRFTPRFVAFLTGWRAVPHDIDHELKILVEMISDDELVNRDLFDRSLITATVDIDAVHEQVEVIQVAGSGSGDLQTLQEIRATVSEINQNNPRRTI